MMQNKFFKRHDVVISDPMLSEIYTLLLSKNFSRIKISPKTVDRIEKLIEREKKQVRTTNIPKPLLVGGDERVSKTQKHIHILKTYLGDMSREEIDDCFQVGISSALVFFRRYIEEVTDLEKNQEHIIYLRHKSDASLFRYMLTLVIKDSVCTLTCPEVGCIIANKGAIVYK